MESVMNWSGLYNHVHGVNHDLIGNKQPLVQIGRALRPYGRGRVKQVLRTLVAGSVGDAATRVQPRVSAHNPTAPASVGGVRTVKSDVLINRNTTQDDVDTFVEAIDYDRLDTGAYPLDKSGNGAGRRAHKQGRM